MKFDTVINSIFDKLSLINSQNTHLIKIRDSLLPKLMSGQIRVPVEVRA